MRMLLSTVGIPDQPTPQLIILVGLIIVVSLMLGWLADGILDDGGFGIVLNGVLLLAGAIGGAIVWRKTGYSVGINQGVSTAFAAAGSGLIALVLAGAVRRSL